MLRHRARQRSDARHSLGWRRTARNSATLQSLMVDTRKLLSAKHVARAVNRPVAMSVTAGLSIQAALLISGVGAARMLGVENRGQLALIVLVPFGLTQIGGLGLPVATTYFIARAPAETRSIVTTVLVPAIVQGCVLTALTAGIFLAIFRDSDSEVRLAALLSLFMVPATLAEQYGLAILQGQHLFRSFNLLRTLAVFLYSGGIVCIVLAGGGSLITVAVAWTIAYTVSGVATLVVVARSLRRA